MKRGVSRRTFLRTSAGLTISLPLLPSMVRAQGGPPPPKFIVFWDTGGTVNNRTSPQQFEATHPWNDWRPTGTADSPVLGPMHQSLAAHADRLLFLSGIDNAAEPGEHVRADLSSLTATRTLETASGPAGGGPSIDQVVAQRLHARWPVPFASVDARVPGQDFGEPSHAGAGLPIAREIDPRVSFARLFGQLDLQATADELARVRAEKRSVLDGALAGFRLLNRSLSGADRRILDGHLSHLRELEQRLAVFDAVEVDPACAPPDIGAAQALGPVASWAIADPSFRETIAPLHVDLLAQALICGLTHVATFHYPDTIEPFLPTPLQDISPQRDGHAMGHLARDLGDSRSAYAAAWRAEMHANRGWKVQQIARMMDALSAHEGLLDRTLLLHTSEFSNAAQHVARDLPIMLAGNAGGLRTGRHLTLSEGGRGDTLETHLDYRSEWSTHNLYTSILQLMGFEDSHFGDDTATRRGPLSL